MFWKEEIKLRDIEFSRKCEPPYSRKVEVIMSLLRIVDKYPKGVQKKLFKVISDICLDERCGELNLEDGSSYDVLEPQ